MKEYIIIELENKRKYAVIDLLEYQEKKYLLTSEVNNEETEISKEFKICIYIEEENKLIELENDYEYEIIKYLFEERLNIKKEEITKKEIPNIEKLKVIDIKGYDYILEKENGERITKNIEIYDDKKLEINDYIYIPEPTLKDDMLQYGKIINKENEIIKIVRKNDEFYLQRYYG